MSDRIRQLFQGTPRAQSHSVSSAAAAANRNTVGITPDTSAQPITTPPLTNDPRHPPLINSGQPYVTSTLGVPPIRTPDKRSQWPSDIIGVTD